MGHEDMEDHNYYYFKNKFKASVPKLKKNYSISFSKTIIQRFFFKNLNLNIPESKNKHQYPLWFYFKVDKKIWYFYHFPSFILRKLPQQG